MAGRFERHKRTKWEWGAPGSRSAEVRAAASPDPDPARKAPARKDTRNWCKGKPGAEHAPHVVLAVDTPQLREHDCRWKVHWDWEVTYDWVTIWTCGHREECSRCGKVLRYTGDLTRAECPVYPGTPEQRAQAEAELAELRSRPVRTWRRKPPITGPQGYRRKRESA